MRVFSEKFGQKITKDVIIILTQDLEMNCLYACKIAKNIWPNEQIEMRGKMVNMSHKLQEYLDHAKKLLRG
jgi:hypothetical protein